jgi:hypothetical protein
MPLNIRFTGYNCENGMADILRDNFDGTSYVLLISIFFPKKLIKKCNTYIEKKTD